LEPPAKQVVFVSQSESITSFFKKIKNIKIKLVLLALLLVLRFYNLNMTISPKTNLTYGEAAQAIKNLLVKSKLINQ
jgi:hypothetical protein